MSCPRRTALLLLLSGVSASAQEGPDTDRAAGARAGAPLQRASAPLPHFDSRTAAVPRPVAAPRASLDQLSDSLPAAQPRSLRAHWGDLGQLVYLWNDGGVLTEAAPYRDREEIAREFLARHAELFRFSAGEIAALRVERHYSDPDGTEYLRYEQTVDGVPVFQGLVQFAFDRDGRMLQAGVAAAIPGLALEAKPALSDEDAIRALYRSVADQKAVLGIATPSTPPPPAVLDRISKRETAAGRNVYANPGGGNLANIVTELRVFAKPGDTPRLAYLVYLRLNGVESYAALLDAQTGALLYRANLFKNAAQGRVFTEHPSAGGRTVESFVGDTTINTAAGWMNLSTVTTGNNVEAYIDANRDGSPDPINTGGLSNGHASNGAQNFDFTYGDGLTGQDPASFRAAAVTNLFYFTNFMHDFSYALGFTEAAGNFQTNNLGRGGTPDDPVNAEAQDGSGVNNANFETLPDGDRPTMQMFLFTRGTTSLTDDLDGDYDADVVYHEYGHGISNRLVGGRFNVTCLDGIQSGAMGEGWSDYWPATIFNDGVVGEYVTQEFTFGIRRFPYGNNYPWGYAALGNFGAFEVHDDGEIWANTLFDMRQTLGAGVSDALVLAAMKLTVCNPSMIAARDAILQADQNSNGGANQTALWHVFARHGMGSGASGNDDPTHNANYTIPSAQGQSFSIGSASIPNNNPTGVTRTITVSSGVTIARVSVIPLVTHPCMGDLVIDLIGPDSTVVNVFNRSLPAGACFQGFSENLNRGFEVSNWNGQNSAGAWKLRVKDLAAGNSGSFSWKLDISGVVAPPPPPSLSIADVTLVEGDSGTTNAAFVVTLSSASAATLSVTFQTSAGSASAGSDYTTTNGTLSFDPGVVSKKIKVPVVGDTAVEPNEDFFVNLTGTAGGPTITDAVGKATITNDDVPPPNVSIADLTVAEGGLGITTTAKFAVTLSQASSKTVTVQWSAANGTATTADGDYLGASGSLTFDPGVTSKNAKVTVNGDSKAEPDETFFVNLTGATNASILDSQAVGTIQTDDAPPPLTLSINDVSLAEGNSGTTTATFTVSLSTTSGSTVTVHFQTANGTATTAEGDYDAASGDLSFGVGVTTQPVQVTIHGDATIEANEDFFVNLSAASGATIADGQGKGAISDDDSPAPPDAIFADGFESGSLSAWSQAVTDNGDLAASTRSALAGSFGVEAKLNDTHALYVQDDTPDSEGRYRARFRFDPNTFGVALDGDKITIFEAAGDSSGRVVALVARKSGGAYQVRAEVTLESGSLSKTSFFALGDAPHAIEIDLQAAASSSSSDGRFELWIDGASKAVLSALDTDGHVDLARMGVITAPAGLSGRLNFDDFVSRRISLIGP